jgi:hypothetical protein
MGVQEEERGFDLRWAFLSRRGRGRKAGMRDQTKGEDAGDCAEFRRVRFDVHDLVAAIVAQAERGWPGILGARMDLRQLAYLSQVPRSKGEFIAMFFGYFLSFQ